jgi:NAD(P)-dependent dehydrogenase (short-subunit alcohol dehydrogenase family)
MTDHPALAPGRAAVITGGAGGIGTAAGKRFAGLGMKVAIADMAGAGLDEAARAIAAAAPDGAGEVLTIACDVSSLDDVRKLKARVYEAFGEVSVLMNNAAARASGGPFDHYEAWQTALGVNLWGVINGVQAFTQAMIDQATPAVIVNTGSKQGITCPPGNTAYNVSKAGVKVLTEGLQHELRNIAGCQVTAHLLVPGWTHTGLTAAAGAEKPAGAWWPEQVIDELLSALAKGDFYIICPDNDVDRAIDAKRILWAAGDIAENRPPLSRWHEDWGPAFVKFLRGG